MMRKFRLASLSHDYFHYVLTDMCSMMSCETIGKFMNRKMPGSTQQESVPSYSLSTVARQEQNDLSNRNIYPFMELQVMVKLLRW